MRRDVRCVGAGGVEEDQCAIPPEGDALHHMTPLLVDPVRLRVAGLLVVIDPAQVRAPTLVVSGPREIQKTGEESPFRVAVRRDVITGSALFR